MPKLLLVAGLLAIAWFWWQGRAANRAVPDEREARAILGVSASAGPDEIRAAHRRLVTAVHPDKGGSADLARRINAARDALLSRRPN
ncbi:MAG: DnaJ domain-containing protein [Sphingomonas sp.]